MKTIPQKFKNGFTLLEVVAVLILTSIGVALGSMLIATTAEVAVSNKQAVEDSQKIQAAMNRLVRELSYARLASVQVTNNGKTLQWTTGHPNRNSEVCVTTWNGTVGSALTLASGGFAATPLLDNVATFSVATDSESVTFTISSTRSAGVEHTATVHPRYD